MSTDAHVCNTLSVSVLPDLNYAGQLALRAEEGLSDMCDTTYITHM